MSITSMGTVRGCNVSEGQLLKVKGDTARAVSKCCYMDIRPYHMVEGDGFRHLAQALINVGAKHGNVRAEDVLPSEKTVGRYTKEAAEDLRSKLKSQFKEACAYLYSECVYLGTVRTCTSGVSYSAGGRLSHKPSALTHQD